MTANKTSRHGCNQATRNASSTYCKDNAFISPSKPTNVVSEPQEIRSVWISIADWLIDHGGLRDA